MANSGSAPGIGVWVIVPVPGIKLNWKMDTGLQTPSGQPSEVPKYVSDKIVPPT